VVADIGLVLFFAAAFVVGVLRGSVRQLIALGAWLIAFVVAAYLRGPVGDWIAGQARQFSREYVDMLAFGLAFVVLLTFAVIIVEIGGSRVHLTQRVAVDDVLGGFLALGVAVLALGAFMIILDSYYAADPATGATQFGLVHDMRTALDASGIANSLRGSLIRGLVALLGPLLPSDVRAVYA
jgi:membrane protein required for colicin V production